MVWYTPQARFTVMSNGPKGDIHVSFPCPSHGLKEKRYISGKLADSFVEMKIKFSRQQDILELSRYASSSNQRGRGEWISKSETITVERLKLGGAFISSVIAEERQALMCLIEGLKLAEAAEELYMVATPHIEKKGISTLDHNTDRPLQFDASPTVLTPVGPEASPTFESKPTPMQVQSEIPVRQNRKRSQSVGMNTGMAMV
jgi:polo-like kinase 4